MKLEDRLIWKKNEPGYEIAKYKGFVFLKDLNLEVYDVDLDPQPCAFCEDTPMKALESLYSRLENIMNELREIFSERNE